MIKSIPDILRGLFGILIIALIVMIPSTLLYRETLSNPIDRFSYPYICLLENGEGWMYEDNKLFGKTCIEVDYISLDVINRTKLDLSNEQLSEKYCNVPSFWNFKVWNSGCIWFEENYSQMIQEGERE